jgi:Holliday junction resolvase
MSDFEWALTSALNSFFEREGIAGIAYRLKQSRFASQLVDILVDSAAPEYYLAIECKSLDARKARSLYFTQHFSSAGGHQITRETEFITRSGRKGILAVELRHGAGKARTAHFVPWGQVYEIFLSGRPGLSLNEIEANPALERRGGAYELSRLDIVRISGYHDIASYKDVLPDRDLAADRDIDADIWPD